MRAALRGVSRGCSALTVGVGWGGVSPGSASPGVGAPFAGSLKGGPHRRPGAIRGRGELDRGGGGEGLRTARTPPAPTPPGPAPSRPLTARVPAPASRGLPRHTHQPARARDAAQTLADLDVAPGGSAPHRTAPHRTGQLTKSVPS